MSISPLALPVSPMQGFGISCDSLSIPFLRPAHFDGGKDGFTVDTILPEVFFRPYIITHQAQVWEHCITIRDLDGPLPLAFTATPYLTRWFLDNVTQEPKGFTLSGVTYGPNPNAREELKPVMTARHTYELGDKPRVVRTEGDERTARQITFNSKAADNAVQIMLTSVHQLNGSITDKFKDPAETLLAFLKDQIHLNAMRDVDSVCVDATPQNPNTKKTDGLSLFNVTVIDEEGADMFTFSCEIYLGPQNFLGRLADDFLSAVLDNTYAPYVKINASLTHDDVADACSPKLIAMIALAEATNRLRHYHRPMTAEERSIPLPNKNSPLARYLKLLET
ncbi:MAG: hypothetical protein ABII18_11710 [bacterium]